MTHKPLSIIIIFSPHHTSADIPASQSSALVPPRTAVGSLSLLSQSLLTWIKTKGLVPSPALPLQTALLPSDPVKFHTDGSCSQRVRVCMLGAAPIPQPSSCSTAPCTAHCTQAPCGEALGGCGALNSRVLLCVPGCSTLPVPLSWGRPKEGQTSQENTGEHFHQQNLWHNVVFLEHGVFSSCLSNASLHV